MRHCQRPIVAHTIEHNSTLTRHTTEPLRAPPTTLWPSNKQTKGKNEEDTVAVGHGYTTADVTLDSYLGSFGPETCI